MKDEAKIIDQTEEWFLATIQQKDVPIDEFLAALAEFRRRNRTDKADACAELLQETLIDRNEPDAALDIMILQAGWHLNEKNFITSSKERLSSLFVNFPDMLDLIPYAGFDSATKARECLRRFKTLRKLKSGSLCYQKTWGFGIVREIDDNTDQVVVDFTTKNAHRMSKAYAAESLSPLADEHILALQHRDPEAFAKRVEEDAAGVIKAFIRDFGPMPVALLQELIIANTQSIKEWKTFWGKARKGLKDDPLIVLPAKRNEALRLLESAESMEDHWIKAFKETRELSRILDLVEDWKNSVNNFQMSDPLRSLIHERLGMVLVGSIGNQDAPAVRAILIAEELGIELPSDKMDDLIDRLLDHKRLRDTMIKLPARAVVRLIPFLASKRRGVFETRLIQLVPELALSDLNIVIDSLLNLGHEVEVVTMLRKVLATGTLPVEVVSWLCGRVSFILKNQLCDADKLIFMALTALEAAHFAGNNLQARNYIRSCLQKDEWLSTVVAPLDHQHRLDLILRLKKTDAFQESERNMMLARLFRLYPELQKDNNKNAPETIVRRVTSFRSYSERQALLRKLITEDIPRNIQDIATARGYGDLSENYEYHAARETQGALMDRRKELEVMLHEVVGTDFKNALTDSVGVGTRVVLRQEDGGSECYCILGEWDHDEKLGIISSSSGLSLILHGHKAGDEVVIPTVTGEKSCVISEITDLPEEILKWMQPVVEKQLG